MVLQLPRLVHTTPLADQDNKPTRELTRFWDRAMSAIENSLRAVSTGIVVAVTSSGEVITRAITGGTGITITNGTGIAGNPTVTLANTAVTPGSYGDASHVSAITVDQQGRLTTAGNVSIVITEAGLSLSDVTTDNATTLKHGFLPKLSGNASQVLIGNGTWGTVTSQHGFDFSAGGTFGADEILGYATLPQRMTFTTGDALTVVKSEYPANASAVLNIKTWVGPQPGTRATVGTLTFSAGGYTGAVAWAGSPYTAAADTLFELHAPVTPDLTLGWITGTVNGVPS